LEVFEAQWKNYAARADSSLKSKLVDVTITPHRLHQALQYVCLNGGKRFRAMLVYACGEVVGASPEKLDTPACALEMVHAYSLVHDDLPAMDDDDLRRGSLTCHKKFDEATAILVGDALQSRAFEIMATQQHADLSRVQQLRMIGELAAAIGSMGMAGGQALDMEATGKTISYDQLVQVHRLKTGALIRAAAIIGGLAGPEVDQDLLDTLERYASSVGLAFQIADDILDHTSNSETLGKPSGADSRMNKVTYVSLLGIDEAKKQARNMSDQAIESIESLGDNSAFLEQLAKFVVSRSY
jgi:geranylgeranyl pyrophosphate synthase